MTLNSLPVDSTDSYTYEYFLQEDVCRLCWCRKGEQHILRNTEKIFIKNALIDKIRDCLDLDFSQGSCPKKACNTCCDKVEKFYEFKVFCREKERQLQEIFKQRDNDINFVVKIEKVEDFSNLELPKTDLIENFLDTISDVDSEHQPSERENSLFENELIRKKKYKPKRSPSYCNICRLDLESKENLTIHNAQSHGIEEESGLFKCFGCEKRFKSRKTRLAHEINFCKGLKDGYKCAVCERFLPKRRMYEAHTRDHRQNACVDLPENIFQCRKCLEQFKTKECLKMHMIEHDNSKKNFICETCGRVFTRQDYLYKHKLTHTGTKQHVCPHCGFRTTQKSSLTVHIRKHTGERPYSCDVCPQRCISSSNLRAHRRRHLGHKRYECTICDKKFGYKISLDEHVASTHERSQSHPCEHCGAIYSRVRGLRRHLLAKHGKQVETDKKGTEEIVMTAVSETENSENNKDENGLKGYQLKDNEFVLISMDDAVILSKVYE